MSRGDMLDVALTFLVKNFNAYLKARTSSELGAAAVSPVADDAGKWLIAPGTIGAALINVEEERILRSPVPETTYVGGRHIVVPPPLKVNLHVLFASNFVNAKGYDQALRYLSYVLKYFQAHPVFTQTEYPDLDPGIERLTVELLSLSYDQLNQIWAFVGAKQLPSAVYKIRVLLLQDADPQIGAPVERIDTDAHRR